LYAPELSTNANGTKLIRLHENFPPKKFLGDAVSTMESNERCRVGSFLTGTKGENVFVHVLLLRPVGADFLDSLNILKQP
jgi:hypothetical protein